MWFATGSCVRCPLKPAPLTRSGLQRRVRAMGHVVAVFGGTGFLGRRVVHRLRNKGFSVRIASRHLSSSRDDDPHVKLIGADIRDRRSVETAVAGAFGVVNAVSLYVERGTDTFQALHVAA